MIRYALKCPSDHGFESWFQSSEAYEALRRAGHVACPACGSTQVEKALMAPSVRTDEGERPLSRPAGERERALAELRRQVEANSEYVGMGFAAEARAIHAGDAPERAIYGEARPDEAKALIEEGVPVAPLPFMPVRKAN
ncbi:MAG: DUF1178 family protein [Paracoccaceae bacterium]